MKNFINTIKWFFRIVKDLIKQSKTTKNTNKSNYSWIQFTSRIMSFNIRRDTPSDNNWPNRRDNIIKFINEQHPGIICIQEAMPHMYKYLDNKLTGDYASYFTDVFTGGSKGALVSEGLAIFVSKERYTIKDYDFVRISDKFGFENKHWRIYQWMKLEDNNTGEYIYVFNTHLDHKDQDARKKGFDMIQSKISNLSGNEVVFVCGDFNAEISWPEMREFAEYFDNTYINEETSIKGRYIVDHVFSKNIGFNEYIRYINNLSDHYPVMLICDK